jgi:hypothetical protein
MTVKHGGESSEQSNAEWSTRDDRVDRPIPVSADELSAAETLLDVHGFGNWKIALHDIVSSPACIPRHSPVDARSGRSRRYPEVPLHETWHMSPHALAKYRDVTVS